MKQPLVLHRSDQNAEQSKIKIIKQFSQQKWNINKKETTITLDRQSQKLSQTKWFNEDIDRLDMQREGELT